MGTFKVNGDLTLSAGDEDRYLTFNYSNQTGYDWRIGYLGSGSGEANYLVIQSDGTDGNFKNALRFGLTTLNAEFGGTVAASSFIGNLTGNADTATKLKTARTISLTGSVTGCGTFDGSGNLSINTTTNHTHSYLPLSGGTMSGSPVIKFPGSGGSISTSDPMAITYGRISAYGTLCINADTDNSTTEYVILTAGKGLSSNVNDGLAIGHSTLTWQGSTVLTTGNFPSSSSLARQTDTWISASNLDVNTYYPVVISLPVQGLNRIKLAVQLDSGTKPSWSTHGGGFTSNIDVEIIAAGWGTVYPFRYLLRQDDYSFANVRPAYFAGQLGNSSLAVFYVRGGGSYRFICDWANASISLRTSSTSYNGQSVAPTTSTSVFHDGTKAHLFCDVDYASYAGSIPWSGITGKPGGLSSMTLLWQNASPSSSFGPQTISLAWSGFHLLVIYFAQTDKGNGTSLIIPAEVGWSGNTSFTGSDSSTGWYIYGIDRYIKIESTNTLYIGEAASRSTYGTLGGQNNRLVPIKIYGIRIN